MDMLAPLGGTFVNICHPASLLLMAVGVAMRIIFSSIPGPLAAVAVASFLPLTFSMMPSMNMNLLVAVYVSGISGGLISAILLNMSGTAPSTATCFGGHSIAKNRGAGRALGYGIVLSFLGSVFSLLVLTLCASLLANIVLEFMPAKNLGISFFALTMVAVLASGSMVEGVLADMLGFIFVLVGMALIDGTPRSTFGSSSLMAGFDTLPTLIGIFVISEIPITAESMGNGEVEAMKMKPVKGFGFARKEFIHQIPDTTRSALMGTGIGILPDVGGSASGMFSYVAAENVSRHPNEFSKGCPDGIVTTEIANNATIGGAMIPLLVPSIPGGGVTAMMLDSFLVHGLSAGPLLSVKDVDVVYGISVVCILCSLFMLIIEFFGIKGFVQLLKIPKHTLMPLILVLYCVGAYAIDNRIFDVQPIILFRTVGYLHRKFKLPTTPFVLCFLIGGVVEIYLRRGIIQYKLFGAFFKRPVPDVSFFVAIIVVAWSTHKEWRMTRARKMQHILKRDK